MGIHRPADPLMSRLKLLQGDSPVTVGVGQDEKHPHHHARTHTPGPPTSLAHHAGAHHAGVHESSTPTPLTPPIGPVTPAHHAAVVGEVILIATRFEAA